MPYPTPPGTRIAYDLDGTVVFYLNRFNEEIEISSEAKARMNGERSGGLTFREWGADEIKSSVVLIFPESTDLSGFICAGVSSGRGSVGGTRFYSCLYKLEISSNTTNGVDGDWHLIQEWSEDRDNYWSRGSANPYGIPVTESLDPSGIGWDASTGVILADVYRRPYNTNSMWETYGIRQLSNIGETRNITGIRITSDRPPNYSNYDQHNSISLHLYRRANSTNKGLAFWSSSQDLETPPGFFDWGDIPLTHTKDKVFRIKNLSDTETASNINVGTHQAASSTSPPPDEFILLSLDNEIWSEEIVISSLAPNSISPNIYMKIVVPSDAKLSVWSPRITLTGVEWT